MICAVRNSCRRGIVYTAGIGRPLREALTSGYSACGGIGDRLRYRICMRPTDRLRLREAVGNAFGNRVIRRLAMRHALTLVLGNRMRHILGAAEGLICSVADRCTRTVALILPECFSEAVTS